MRIVIMLVLFFVNTTLYAQLFPGVTLPKTSAKSDFKWAEKYGKSSTEFNVEDWQQIIDATWGTGISTSEKLAIFDFWFNEVDLTYAGFHNDDIDIFALRDRYRPEIEAGVSRGRFSGIMNHFTFQLNELHTYIFDVPVWITAKNRGIPLMTIGQWSLNQHFGALLTPLPDSSLLVYKALPGHPIGLQPGDVVLGYDGVPWKDIYPTLLEAELPIFYNSVNASTKAANDYYILQAAGLNWHLFDTIDVLKYSSNDTLHYDTNLLAGQSRTIWGSEQIDVPGVEWPDRSNGDRVNWGIVEGTQIGYIYVTSWSFDAQFNIRAEFRQAVDSLMHHSDTDGIIFDFRYNTGGGALGRDGFQLLFNTIVPTVGFDKKFRSSNHFVMIPDPLRLEANLVIQGNPLTFYDKPIAILIGPGSISAGELEALRLSFHPRARIFGREAPGGNTGSDFIDIGNNDWFASLSNSAMYRVIDHEYLVHIGLAPDEPVWFDRDDVANGVDTVVESAKAWIMSQIVGIADDAPETTPGTYALDQNYPNPFNPVTNIGFQIPPGGGAASEFVQLAVYDITGRVVKTLVNENRPAGNYVVQWDGTNNLGQTVGSGIYLYELSAGSFQQVKKMMLIK